jgi:hypothetical protein
MYTVLLSMLFGVELTVILIVQPLQNDGDVVLHGIKHSAFGQKEKGCMRR